MCDLVPGYVTTFCDPRFDKIKEDLIVVGLESGKIYAVLATKAELLAKLAQRKKQTHLVCYYRNVVFTAAEEKQIFRANVRLVDEAGKQRIAASWMGAMALVMR
jgi:hypothetical protein